MLAAIYYMALQCTTCHGQMSCLRAVMAINGLSSLLRL